MFGYPIPNTIQETLNKRKELLKRNKNPYASTGGKNPSKEIQKSLVRTPYISMFSSPKLVDTNGDTFNRFDNNDIIISNQEYNRPSDDVDFNPINYGFGMYTDIEDGKYKRELDSQGNKKYQSVFKPKPGVISLTSEYFSSNNVQFVRRVSINWRCYHMDDLERLSYRFLTYNKLVYVEWGWTYADKPATTFITPENLKRINNPTTLRDEVVEQGKGNFDAVLGVIDNFEWTSTGGGFECRTDIVAHGVDILNQRVDNDSTKIETTGQTTISIPQTFDSQIEKDSAESIKEEYLKLKKKQQGTDFTKHKYYTKYGANTRPPQFLTNEEQQRLRTLEPIFASLGDTITPTTNAVVSNQEDATKTIESSDYATEHEETFKTTLEFLPDLIKDKLKPNSGGFITSEIIRNRTSQIEEKLKDFREKKSNEIQELIKKVKTEYENKNFKDWEKGVQDTDKNSAITIEVNRRFEKQYDLSVVSSPSGAKRALDTFVERERSKYNLTPDDMYDLSVDYEILNTKNFIQQINYEKKIAPEGMFHMKDDKVAKMKILPEKTWVRWGWFEDNILNRFFGLVNGSGDTILKIRSVRNAVDDNGVVILEDGKPKKVQESITNHPKFLTPDIGRFIFPGKFKVSNSSESETEYSYSKSKINLLTSDNYEETEEFQNTSLWQKKDDSGTIIDTQIVFTDFDEDSGSTDKIINKYKSHIDENEIRKEIVSYKILKELESIVQDKKQVDSFDVEGSEYEGVLRNIFINVKNLQDVFSNKTTLGNCLSLLSESLNTTSQLFNITAQVNTTQDEGHIVFTDKRFLPNFKPTKNKVYEFPIKITESFVKSTNLQSDANSEAQKILLSKQYSKMQNIYNTENLYGPRNESIDAQSTWDSMGEEGVPTTDPTKLNLPGVPPYLYSKVKLGQGGLFGEIDGDYRNELQFNSRNFSFNLHNEDVKKKITERIQKRNQDEKTTESETKYLVNFPGNYTKEGILKSKPSKDNITGLNTLERKSPYDEFGLLFLQNTISMDGIAGIYPGCIYTSRYIPEKFYKNAFFFVENLTQTIDSATWSTDITGRVLFKHKVTDGNMTVEDEMLVGKEDE